MGVSEEVWMVRRAWRLVRDKEEEEEEETPRRPRKRDI